MILDKPIRMSASPEDHAAMHEAIAANPHDDGPRLIYADMLDQSGHPHLAEAYRRTTLQGQMPWYGSHAGALHSECYGEHKHIPNAGVQVEIYDGHAAQNPTGKDFARIILGEKKSHPESRENEHFPQYETDDMEHVRGLLSELDPVALRGMGSHRAMWQVMSAARTTDTDKWDTRETFRFAKAGQPVKLGLMPPRDDRIPPGDPRHGVDSPDSIPFRPSLEPRDLELMAQIKDDDHERWRITGDHLYENGHPALGRALMTGEPYSTERAFELMDQTKEYSLADCGVTVASHSGYNSGRRLFQHVMYHPGGKWAQLMVMAGRVSHPWDRGRTTFLLTDPEVIRDVVHEGMEKDRELNAGRHPLLNRMHKDSNAEAHAVLDALHADHPDLPREPMRWSKGGKPVRMGMPFDADAHYEALNASPHEPDMAEYIRHRFAPDYGHSTPDHPVHNGTGFILPDGTPVSMGDQHTRMEDHRSAIPRHDAMVRWGWPQHVTDEYAQGNRSPALAETVRRARAVRIHVDPRTVATESHGPTTQRQRDAIAMHIMRAKPKSLIMQHAGHDVAIDNPSADDVDRHLRKRPVGMSMRERLRQAVRMGRDDNPHIFEAVKADPHNEGPWHMLADSLDQSGKPHFAGLMRDIATRGRKVDRSTQPTMHYDETNDVFPRSTLPRFEEDITGHIAGVPVSFGVHGDFVALKLHDRRTFHGSPNGPHYFHPASIYVTNQRAADIASEMDERRPTWGEPAPESPERFAYQAPKGGLVVRGVNYPAGQMVPKEAVQPAPAAAPPPKKADGATRRRIRGHLKQAKKFSRGTPVRLMHDTPLFGAQIAASPDDSAPKLIYADYIQEHGLDHTADAIRRDNGMPTEHERGHKIGGYEWQSIGSISGMIGRDRDEILPHAHISTERNQETHQIRHNVLITLPLADYFKAADGAWFTTTDHDLVRGLVSELKPWPGNTSPQAMRWRKFLEGLDDRPVRPEQFSRYIGETHPKMTAKADGPVEYLDEKSRRDAILGIRNMTGKDYNDHQAAALFGWVPGSVVRSELYMTHKDEHMLETSAVDRDSFGGSYEVSRKLHAYPGGSLTLHTAFTGIPRLGHDGAPNPFRGLSASNIARAIHAAHELGIPRMTSDCAWDNSKHPYFTGARHWPLIGYDGSIPEWHIAKIPPHIRAEVDLWTGGRFGSTRSVYDLVSHPEGRQWWFDNPHEFKGWIETRPGSRTRERVMESIQEALEKHRIRPVPAIPGPERMQMVLGSGQDAVSLDSAMQNLVKNGVVHPDHADDLLP